MATKPGRPTKYNHKLALKICERLSVGESLRSICRDPKMPVRQTIITWLLDEDKKEFLDQYNTARELGHSELFEQLLEIADDGTNDYMERESKDGSTYEVVNSEVVQRSKLRVDTRKWYLSKLAPKIYGDKMDITSGGEKFDKAPVEVTVKIEQALDDI